MSGHVAVLRKELDDPLFTRSPSGIGFTPGGLRLATRATEMLGLQDQTIREVSAAGRGRRLLRLATSSLFAEHAAPGLIQLFTSRAEDLDVELSVRPTAQLASLLTTRAIDMAIGPSDALTSAELPAPRVPQVPDGRGRRRPATSWRAADRVPTRCASSCGCSGPRRAEHDGVTRRLLRHFEVPEDAPAHLPEPRRRPGGGQARQRRRRRASPSAWPTTSPRAAWCRSTCAAHARGGDVERDDAPRPQHRPRPPPSSAASSPRREPPRRCCKAPARTIGHFRPSVHVTLWS